MTSRFTYCCLLAKSCLILTPWTVACQTPLSMGVPRQGCWSGLPLPSPGDLPDPRIKPTSLESPSSAGDSLPLHRLEALVYGWSLV